MKKNLLAACSLVALTTCFVAHSASAQSIDYGSLQELFGEAVTTGATGTPQKVSDAPANMTIITSDEIRQAGTRNIPEIIGQYVAGVDVVQEGFNSFDVAVRGFQQPYQPRMLVLVDGRQVFDDDYSRTLWDNIPVNIDDIRQIEVVKGASSALFGSNAASGVINIITYSPIYDDNNVASITGGTQNSISGDGTLTRKGSWGGTKFSVGGMNSDEFSTGRYQNTDLTPPLSPKKRYATNSSVFQLTPKLQANSEMTYSESVMNTADPTSFVIMGGQKTNTYSLRGGAAWDSSIGMITSNNYFNHTFVSEIQTSDNGKPYNLTTDLIVSQLQDQFKVGPNNTFRASLEYRHKAFKNDGVQLANQTPSVEVNSFAAGGTWLWQINKELSWTNAARVDHQGMRETGTIDPNAYSGEADYSHVINTWTGNSDLVWQPTDKDSFRLGYGRGVQMPSLMQAAWNIVENFASPGKPDCFCDFEGNPKLKPTITKDYSLDYERKVDDISSTAKFSTFYIISDDIVAPFPAVLDSSGNQVYRTFNSVSYPVYNSQNVGSSRAYGVELEIKGKSSSGFRWDGSYSYARVTDSDNVGLLVDYQGSAPQHQFRLNVGYTAGKWEFDTHGKVVTSTNMLRSPDGGYSQAKYLTDGYFTMGGRVGYKLSDTYTVAVSGQNLNRRRIGESVFPAVERQAFVTVTGKF